MSGFSRKKPRLILSCIPLFEVAIFAHAAPSYRPLAMTGCCFFLLAFPYLEGLIFSKNWPVTR